MNKRTMQNAKFKMKIAKCKMGGPAKSKKNCHDLLGTVNFDGLAKSRLTGENRCPVFS
jgi:hypothetical protein